MLDEICLRAVDWVTESLSRWVAPWKIWLKRSAIGFRIALIFGPIIRVLKQFLSNMTKKREQGAKAKEEVKTKENAEAKTEEIKEATEAKEEAKEDVFLRWFLKEPVVSAKKVPRWQKMALLMVRADAFFTGKTFPYLLLLTMISVCLLAGSGTRALAVMAAFFCLNWLAEAFAQDYEPVCGGVRQRYLVSTLLRACAYLVLLLDYFAVYAANGLQINVVLQGAMILTVLLHVMIYIGLTAFNKRQQLFLRVLCGLLGFVPALACAAGIALSASTVARGVVIALSGILRAVGVSLSFLSWEIGTNGELSGGRLRYYGLWQSLTMMIGFFMMLLGAWLSAQ